MNSDLWRKELEMLESILADIDSGYIRLEQGQEDYLASLAKRIKHLDEKIAQTGERIEI